MCYVLDLILIFLENVYRNDASSCRQLRGSILEVHGVILAELANLIGHGEDNLVLLVEVKYPQVSFHKLNWASYQKVEIKSV